MASIKIDRSKYSSAKSKASWLDNFFTAQVKERTQVTKTIKDKEVTSNVDTIVAWKLFALVKNNGLNFPNIQKQVEDEKHGAIGRARMILAGALKKKIANGDVLKDVENNDVPQDEAFLAYRATLPAKPAAAPAAPAAASGEEAGPIGGEVAA